MLPPCICICSQRCFGQAAPPSFFSFRFDLRKSHHLASHRVLRGGYKWMLWGDDDTIWFPHGASALLRNWDHTLPHLISGRACLRPSLPPAPAACDTSHVAAGGIRWPYTPW